MGAARTSRDLCSCLRRRRLGYRSYLLDPRNLLCGLVSTLFPALHGVSIHSIVAPGLESFIGLLFLIARACNFNADWDKPSSE